MTGGEKMTIGSMRRGEEIKCENWEVGGRHKKKGSKMKGGESDEREEK